MRTQYVGRIKRLTLFDIFNYALMVLLCFMFVYPLIMTFALSLSEPRELVGQNAYFLPRGFSLDSYKILLSNNNLALYYFNTFIYAAVGTVIMLFVTSLLAYPICCKDFKGQKTITVILLITMFFSGGLIPTYLTMKYYNMINTIWVIVIPGAVSAWNVMIFKTFFAGIPESLREAAFMDGAGHFRVLFNIMLPLSKALLATFTLFSVVGFWNDYFNAFMYLKDDAKMPIQMLLRRMVVSMEYTDSKNADILLQLTKSNPRTAKAAVTIITVLPILCIYPFLQKYFTKGIMLGSVKS